MFLQDIKANAAIAVDIGMENLCPESYLEKRQKGNISFNKQIILQFSNELFIICIYLWWLKWIIWREMNGN